MLKIFIVLYQTVGVDPEVPQTVRTAALLTEARLNTRCLLLNMRGYVLKYVSKEYLINKISPKYV